MVRPLPAARARPLASPEPVSALDLCLHATGPDSPITVHAELDGARLAPVTVEISPAALQRELDAELHALTRGLGASQKLVRYHDNLERVGARLGAVLFGDSSATAAHPIAHALDAVHHRARQGQDFVSVRLAATFPELHNLPWELAVFQPRHASAPTVLGTDDNLALVRQTVFPDYVADRSRPAGDASLRIVHVTADRTQRKFMHERIAGALQALERQNWRVRASCAYSEDWAANPSALGADIFQLLAHGMRAPGSFEIAVAGPGSEPSRSRSLEMDIDTLLTLLDRTRLPRLFILFACWSFDHYQHRGMVADLLARGAGAALGILGELRMGKSVAMSEYFHHQLLCHGRLDRAVQRLRALMQRYELTASMTPDAALPSDWYRTALMIRSPDVLGAFCHLPRTTHAPRARADEPSPIAILEPVREAHERIARTPAHERTRAVSQALERLSGHDSSDADGASAGDIWARWEACRLGAVVSALARGAAPEPIDALMAHPGKDTEP